MSKRRKSVKIPFVLPLFPEGGRCRPERVYNKPAAERSGIPVQGNAFPLYGHLKKFILSQDIFVIWGFEKVEWLFRKTRSLIEMFC